MHILGCLVVRYPPWSTTPRCWSQSYLLVNYRSRGSPCFSIWTATSGFFHLKIFICWVSLFPQSDATGQLGNWTSGAPKTPSCATRCPSAKAPWAAPWAIAKCMRKSSQNNGPAPWSLHLGPKQILRNIQIGCYFLEETMDVFFLVGQISPFFLALLINSFFCWNTCLSQHFWALGVNSALLWRSGLVA